MKLLELIRTFQLINSFQSQIKTFFTPKYVVQLNLLIRASVTEYY